MESMAIPNDNPGENNDLHGRCGGQSQTAQFMGIGWDNAQNLLVLPLSAEYAREPDNTRRYNDCSYVVKVGMT